MIFQALKLKDAYLIHQEKHEDKRGYFARSFCEQEFKKHGIDFTVRQCNMSFNSYCGTLRGMHYQKEPFEEQKLVTCLSGEIYDVILDLRQDSPTFGEWASVHLSVKNQNTLYVPKGFAHGFQTLQDNVMVHYTMGEYYVEKYAAGIRWNDSRFNIRWPLENMIISDKDRQYEDF